MLDKKCLFLNYVNQYEFSVKFCQTIRGHMNILKLSSISRLFSSLKNGQLFRSVFVISRSFLQMQEHIEKWIGIRRSIRARSTRTQACSSRRRPFHVVHGGGHARIDYFRELFRVVPDLLRGDFVQLQKRRRLRPRPGILNKPYRVIPLSSMAVHLNAFFQTLLDFWAYCFVPQLGEPTLDLFNLALGTFKADRAC